MATIRDVARESGVSVATVSYVLNNGPRPVRPQTKERVLATMRRLNYHPNAMARGLVRRRMHSVAVLFGQIETSIVTNPYANAVLEGILSAAAELDYSVTLFPKQWVDIRHSAGAFRDRRTDGVIVIAPQEHSDAVPGLAELGLPLVVVSSPTQQYRVPYFDVDNVTGARLATEHLIALGHTRIGHITGQQGYASVHTRRQGYREALDTAGIPYRSEYVVEGRYDGSKTTECFVHLLSLPDPPTAIFAGNDMMAFRVLDEAFARGIRIPEHLSIVGFDNIPLSASVRPPLTTVEQPLTTIGSEALRLLVQRIDASLLKVEFTGELRHIFVPRLVVRDTTVPPLATSPRA